VSDQIDVPSIFGPREELPLPTIGIEVGHEGKVKNHSALWYIKFLHSEILNLLGCFAASFTVLLVAFWDSV
jgi:hypothetical protein